MAGLGVVGPPRRPLSAHSGREDRGTFPKTGEDERGGFYFQGERSEDQCDLQNYLEKSLRNVHREVEDLLISLTLHRMSLWYPQE